MLRGSIVERDVDIFGLLLPTEKHREYNSVVICDIAGPKTVLNYYYCCCQQHFPNR